ncbi:MAG: hypothetical protein GXY40_01220 [Syntrophomonadaceae bacterium]|mgnify:CR=1 FL=1|jgi:hypothetical protein|nr:hypothetical protein [Syntrophomonadaceae bacterium]
MSRSDCIVTSTLCRAGFYFPLITNNDATKTAGDGGLILLPFFTPCNISSCEQTQPGFALDCYSSQPFLNAANTIIERNIPLYHLSYVTNHDGGLERW